MKNALIVRQEVQAVIFDDVGNAKKVLILKKIDYSARHHRWRLLKGGVYNGETEIQGLQREIYEEKGLKNIEILSKVQTYEFSFRGIRHTVSSYLVKADSREPVRLHKSEVADYLWTTKQEALQMLYWNNERNALACLR